ncbi:MAG TPA: hypothetical protein VN682_10100 [Terriglobales bacterium]|nr:hypothetical protein [Terriglobales bacterium]HXF14887.1 hypothetical protein [Terriglobales bacterium]
MSNDDKKITPDWDRPGIGAIFRDPGASIWLKNALRSALSRDPVDAANDAEVLARLLDRRCREILRTSP